MSHVESLVAADAARGIGIRIHAVRPAFRIVLRHRVVMVVGPVLSDRPAIDAGPGRSSSALRSHSIVSRLVSSRVTLPKMVLVTVTQAWGLDHVGVAMPPHSGEMLVAELMRSAVQVRAEVDRADPSTGPLWVVDGQLSCPTKAIVVSLAEAPILGPRPPDAPVDGAACVLCAFGTDVRCRHDVLV